MLRFLLVISLAINAFQSNSQDQLLLLNGRQFNVIIDTVIDEQIYFTLLRPGLDKDDIADVEDVFSYTKFNETETVLYRKDEDAGKEFTVDEQRHYIFGEQDARRSYSTKWTKIVGFTAGFGGTVVLDSGAIPFLIPAVYSGSMQIPIIKIKPETVSDMNFKNFETYPLGYERVARGKKFMASFFSSLIGVGLGTAFVELTR